MKRGGRVGETGNMAAGISLLSGGFGEVDYELRRSQFLFPGPCLPCLQFLGGKYRVQPSPVVPEVKIYRHVSIMFWGADRYPGTGPSTSAEASARKSVIPAGWVSEPAAHRWSPMALRAGRSGSRDSRNSGWGGKA